MLVVPVEPVQFSQTSTAVRLECQSQRFRAGCGGLTSARVDENQREPQLFAIVTRKSFHPSETNLNASHPGKRPILDTRQQDKPSY
jgi:hypothetical protein